ncbi:hypothetical protein Hanom_Chr07g00611301 [Helianthus anomalus]
MLPESVLTGLLDAGGGGISGAARSGSVLVAFWFRLCPLKEYKHVLVHSVKNSD